MNTCANCECCIPTQCEETYCQECNHCINCGEAGHVHDSEGESVCEMYSPSSNARNKPSSDGVQEQIEEQVQQCIKCGNMNNLTLVFDWTTGNPASVVCTDCLCVQQD